MGERQFGPYRLVQQIAVGGMAEIHLAKTSGVAGFEKYVALKMIHPNFSQDEGFVQMLIDEAKITVQLQHANIAQTFDLGRVGNTFYLTMEFVDGVDLFSLLRTSAEQERHMPFDIAAHVCRSVANGLDYAHRKRDVSGRALDIVHRDVSPQNVLLSYSGEIKLIDFGIAKVSHRARQTEAGVIKGKYYYMSPEQALAETLDHRSDIFSAGILLHEMLTGQMLYMEEDLQKLLIRVRKADIPFPSTVREGIPPKLEQIVMRALAKRPGDRFQSAADLSTALGAFLNEHSPVFTAAKVSGYVREVARAKSQPPPPSQPQAPEPPSRSSGRVTKEHLLREPSEFYDENSVIFRAQELGGVPGKSPAAKPAAASAAKPPSAGASQPSPFARGADVSTKLLDSSTSEVGEEEEEQTMISGPPAFGLEDRKRAPAPPPPPAMTRPPAAATERHGPRPGSRSGLPLEAPTYTDTRPPTASPGRHDPSPAKPAAAPTSSQPGQVEASSGPGATGRRQPAAAPGDPARQGAHAPPPNTDFFGSQPPTLAPTTLHSPLVIASLVILGLAIVGAAVGAVFLEDPPAGDPERRVELRVQTDPVGAKVYLDGRLLGEAPLESELSASSANTLKVRLAGYQPQEHELDWSDSDSLTLDITLEP